MRTDLYIDRVLDYLPRATPRRQQIVLELRAHIAERTAAGHAEADVLRQLGDPLTLAESYLAALPLVSASFSRRAVAKIVDVLTAVIIVLPLAAMLWLGAMQWLPSAVDLAAFAFLAGIVGGTWLFAVYVIVAEARVGQTLGKRLLSVRVVRESGARISLGQSVVRQLPMFLEVFWIDVLFALFTEKSQRAFELLSKTRVVMVDSGRPADRV